MIERKLAPHLLASAGRFPVVTVVGPRQSGKTTLCRTTFGDKPYASLEAPDVRAFATTDPRSFLGQFPTGAVLDEIQRVPDLLSYIQVDVDERPLMGRWILTGSQNLALLSGVTQSLAGRTSLHRLLPLSLQELANAGLAPREVWEAVYAGGYPAIYDRSIPPREWHSSYVEAYVERDVRQIVNVGDLGAFQAFLRLCAGRTGQVLNVAALGSDAGVSHHTAKAWLSVLAATFVAEPLAPWLANFTKRETRSPKLHFLDSGLVCWLLGIRSPNDLRSHPLRGPIFETWVGAEIAKSRYHAGERPRMFYYRDSRGLEIDYILDEPPSVVAVEVKSGATVASDWFDALTRFASAASARGAQVAPCVVYAGDDSTERSTGQVISWRDVGRM